MRPVIELVQITGVSHPRPGWSCITFDNGAVREIEWKRYAGDGPVFAKLADPEYANRCTAVDNGYALEWPDGMDWSAGAVLQAGVPVRRSVGGPLFKARSRGRAARLGSQRNVK
jgi:hypothetical protein